MSERPPDEITDNVDATREGDGADYRRAYGELLRTYERNQRSLWHFQQFELRVLGCQAMADLLDLLLAESLHYFQLDSVFLLMYDPERSCREVLNAAVERRPLNIRFTVEHADIESRFPDGVKVMIGGPELLADTAQSVAGESFALLPLVRHGFLIGYLRLGSSDQDRFVEGLSVGYLTHFAAVVAICLENSLNRERLRLHSQIDVLTGVRNRRGFQEALASEVARAIRSGRPLTAMFIDLDHFKRVNDRYGHPSGDRALRQVAQAIQATLRATDQLARYGGEEFVALLPDCDHVHARNIAARINEHVASLQLVSGDGEPFSLTCSVGYSSWLNPSGHEFEARAMGERLLAQADKAVYRAKQEGRNKGCYLAFDAGGH